MTTSNPTSPTLDPLSYHHRKRLAHTLEIGATGDLPAWYQIGMDLAERHHSKSYKGETGKRSSFRDYCRTALHLPANRIYVLLTATQRAQELARHDAKHVPACESDVWPLIPLSDGDMTVAPDLASIFGDPESSW